MRKISETEKPDNYVKYPPKIPFITRFIEVGTCVIWNRDLTSKTERSRICLYTVIDYRGRLVLTLLVRPSRQRHRPTDGRTTRMGSTKKYVIYCYDPRKGKRGRWILVVTFVTKFTISRRNLNIMGKNNTPTRWNSVVPVSTSTVCNFIELGIFKTSVSNIKSNSELTEYCNSSRRLGICSRWGTSGRRCTRLRTCSGRFSVFRNVRKCRRSWVRKYKNTLVESFWCNTFTGSLYPGPLLSLFHTSSKEN